MSNFVNDKNTQRVNLFIAEQRIINEEQNDINICQSNTNDCFESSLITLFDAATILFKKIEIIKNALMRLWITLFGLIVVDVITIILFYVYYFSQLQ